MTCIFAPFQKAYLSIFPVFQHAAGAVPWPTGGPSITHGLPKHPAASMAVPPEALSLTTHHQSAFTHRGIPPPHQVAPREHLPLKKEDKVRVLFFSFIKLCAFQIALDYEEGTDG